MRSFFLIAALAALATAQVTRDNLGYDTTTIEEASPTDHEEHSAPSTTVSAAQYPAYSAPASSENPYNYGGDEESTSSPAAKATDYNYHASSPAAQTWATSTTSSKAYGYATTSAYSAATSASSSHYYSSSKSTSTTSSGLSAFTGAASHGKELSFGVGIAVAGLAVML